MCQSGAQLPPPLPMWCSSSMAQSEALCSRWVLVPKFPKMVSPGHLLLLCCDDTCPGQLSCWFHPMPSICRWICAVRLQPSAPWSSV